MQVNSFYCYCNLRELFDFAIDERKLYGKEVFAESFFKEADLNKYFYYSLLKLQEII